MRVLLIKTSSMGDLIHTLPALTDAKQAVPGIVFDWLVEENFAQIPSWHSAVDRIIPIALRRWRKNLFAAQTRQEWRELRTQLAAPTYDLILDAQGLMKSAWLGFFIKGVRAGLDFPSAREGLASLFYQRKYTVDFYQHAITRMRLLFSQALAYPLPTSAHNFNLDHAQFTVSQSQEPYVVFLHGTTWASKQWPEAYWIELAKLAAQEGLRIKVSGGSDAEVARSMRLAQAVNVVDVAPRLDLLSMAKWLAHAKAVVAVDTGFAHLSAALGTPTVSIYGSTNPGYTGAIGPVSVQLAAQFPCSPCLRRECNYKKPSVVVPACYGTLPPLAVWQMVKQVMRESLPLEKRG